ncbi:hypothetical protein BRAO375_90009 [Bradyrhizobium sp. ORS 375]|nr:hypothetical protein BRAO375_90009 [Bradyrhizobium sp. ORS 375]
MKIQGLTLDVPGFDHDQLLASRAVLMDCNRFRL